MQFNVFFYAMKKKSTYSHDDELTVVQAEVSRQVNKTLEMFHIFAKKNFRDYPEKLHELGVFQDTAFTAFLLSFHEAAAMLGPEMNPQTDIPKGHWLDMDSFGRLVGNGLATAMLATPLGSKEVEKVKTYLDNKVVASFLYEFANVVISTVRLRELDESSSETFLENDRI